MTGAARREGTLRTTGRGVSAVAVGSLLAALVACGSSEAELFTPPEIECPEGSTPELFRFSESRIESRRMLSDVGWRCLAADGVRHGPSQEWFAGGQPSAYSEWWRGEKHGRFVMWHPNGQKSAEGAHSHWKPRGVWTRWDDQGRVLTQRDFGAGPEEDGGTDGGADAKQPSGGPS